MEFAVHGEVGRAERRGERAERREEGGGRREERTAGWWQAITESDERGKR